MCDIHKGIAIIGFTLYTIGRTDAVSVAQIKAPPKSSGAFSVVVCISAQVVDSASGVVWYNFRMSNFEEEKASVMSQDLSPEMMARATAPKKTWFFERMGDGKIFATEESEAWQICYNKSTWKRRDFRLVGTSDGTTYNRIVKESMVEAHQLAPKIEEKKKELLRYQKAEEDLIMNQAVDMEGDPSDKVNEENKQKVLRLRTIMDRIHGELDVMEERYKDITSAVVQRATDAEMEVAKANQAKRVAESLDVDWPDQNLNIITPAGSSKPRSKIVGILEGRV